MKAEAKENISALNSTESHDLKTEDPCKLRSQTLELTQKAQPLSNSNLLSMGIISLFSSSMLVELISPYRVVILLK